MDKPVKKAGFLLYRNRFNPDTADDKFFIRRDLFTVFTQTGDVEFNCFLDP
jgi:hypothetical protein